MRETYDAVIIGGGAAGTATAMALAHAGRSVAVLERSHYEQSRIGETLPPRTRVLLQQLGVWDRFMADAHAPAPGAVAVWGSDKPYENQFIFNPYGNGWHLDRVRFDRMLAACAEEAGATICRGARVTLCDPQGSHEALDANGWHIGFTTGGENRKICAQFVVDASGRSSFVARRQGARRIEYDRLVGIVGFFCAEPKSVTARDHRTMVEAAREGWWYSARLPDARRVVAYMTDADLIPRGAARVRDFWETRLAGTTFTRERAGGTTLDRRLETIGANSSRLDYVTGKNWLAVGDAAMALDPLSSQGIYDALDSGVRAARAIEQSCMDSDGLGEYVNWAETKFVKFLDARNYYYAQETRWPASVFWQRRHIGHQTI